MIKKYDARIMRQNDQLLSLKQLSHKRSLPEREKLASKLSTTEKELKEEKEKNKVSIFEFLLQLYISIFFSLINRAVLRV